MRSALVLMGMALILGLAAGCAKKEKPAPAADPVAAMQEKTGETAPVSLTRDLMPLFMRSCGACHQRVGGNPHATEEKVYYETKEDILGRVGRAIKAGNPDESGLVKILDQTKTVTEKKMVMPPAVSKVKKWSADEVALFTRWIKEGAKDN